MKKMKKRGLAWALSVALGFVCALVLGVLFYGARDFLNRAFHALSNTKTPMRFAMISVAINIVLNLLLPKNMEIDKMDS